MQPSEERATSSSIAVAIVPPTETQAAIDILRTALAVADRTLPLLKMLTPFFMPQLFTQRGIVEDLATVCSWPLRLDSLDIFEHGKKGFTLQLIPAVLVEQDLKTLHNRLGAQFPKCASKIHAFKPHLTLAHFATRLEAEAAQTKIRSALAPIEWIVDKLHIVEDEGQTTKILHSVPLTHNPTPAPATLPTVADFSVVPVFRFRSGQWKPIDMAVEPPATPATVNVVSWNVLYHLHQAEKIFTSDRIPHILRALEATNADIIGLQEITREFVAAIVAVDWVRQRYYISDVAGTTVRPYGQIILSVFPFAASMHLFNAQKKVVVADFSLHGRRLVVPVLHLTSSLSKNPLATRQTQIQVIYDCIPPNADSLIMGDFNIETEEETKTIMRPQWTDCWNSQEIGYTFDPHVNTTANITSRAKLSRRYDRCLVRAAHLQPTSISTVRALFGTDSITWTAAASEGVKSVVLFPSDHYGVRTTFKWEASPAIPILDELYSAIARYQPFECAAGVQVMSQLPGRVAQILQRCVPLPIVIQPSGGLRLGSYSPNSDADLVCFARFAPAEFFELAKKALLTPESGITAIRMVPEAFVPLLTFRWNQIEVDLEYCCVPAAIGDLQKAPSLLTNEIAKQMDEKSLRCINGCRDWDLLLGAVPNAAEFRLFVAAVKLWAKRRGIYGARMGFLGGFSYTILAARIAQMYPRADTREQINQFFAFYGAWDWNKPIAVLLSDPPTYTPEGRDQISIVTLAKPIRNSARHVTVSTRHIICSELARGSAICKASRVTLPLSALVDELLQEATFFRLHQFYVQIAVSALAKREFVAFTGYVEGKFPVLLIRVEEARFTAFPLVQSTRNVQSSFPFSVSYWIGLDCGPIDATNVTAGIADVIATFRKTDAMDISAKLRKPEEAQALAGSETQEDEDEDDEEEEEEEEEAEAGDDKKPAAAHTNSKGRWAPHKQKKYKRVDVDSLDNGGAETVSKTEKMRTGIEAYNRLKWDESIDTKDVMIGFEDRFLGVVECPWHEFDIENVPLHRLRYFKHKGIVVYDRIHRIDTLFQHRKNKP